MLKNAPPFFTCVEIRGGFIDTTPFNMVSFVCILGVLVHADS